MPKLDPANGVMWAAGSLLQRLVPEVAAARNVNVTPQSRGVLIHGR
jgi:hypothetical protein